MTNKDIEKRIRAIALKSSKFKIGKTGMNGTERLSAYKSYRRIEEICWSKTPEKINNLESKMINKFINWKTNKNKKGGSAGEMSKSDKYILYVVYTVKRKPKKFNG